MAHYLIIAASSGIGDALNRRLRAAGHEVKTTARNADRISPDFTVDAADFDALANVVQQCGALDGIVNCSGSLHLRAAHMTTADAFRSVIDASLTTAFATVRAAGMHMKQGGSVVLISSAAALGGFANHEAIAAAKAGIVGLTMSAAATYAPSGLRFNAVAPGLTETPLTSALTANPASRKVSEAMHALGRLGSADDIARAIEFLLDPANNWISGQVLAVDGGLSTLRPKPKA